MPVTLSAQSRQYRLMLGRAKLNKITDPPSAPAPLFLVTHAYTPAQPVIHFNYVVVLHPDAEIIHPSMDVKAKGCIPVVHGDTPTASGKAAQPFFSPDKNVNFPCRNAAFTLSPEPVGFVVLCQLAHGLSLVCYFCSSSRTFALRLPSDGRSSSQSSSRPCLRLVLLLGFISIK